MQIRISFRLYLAKTNGQALLNTKNMWAYVTKVMFLLTLVSNKESLVFHHNLDNHPFHLKRGYQLKLLFIFRIKRDSELICLYNSQNISSVPRSVSLLYTYSIGVRRVCSLASPV